MSGTTGSGRPGGGTTGSTALDGPREGVEDRLQVVDLPEAADEVVLRLLARRAVQRHVERHHVGVLGGAPAGLDLIVLVAPAPEQAAPAPGLVGLGGRVLREIGRAHV